MKTGIFYGSTTGNTQSAADLIGRLIEDAQIQSIAGAGKIDFEKHIENQGEQTQERISRWVDQHFAEQILRSDCTDLDPVRSTVSG